MSGKIAKRARREAGKAKRTALSANGNGAKNPRASEAVIQAMQIICCAAILAPAQNLIDAEHRIGAMRFMAQYFGVDARVLATPPRPRQQQQPAETPSAEPVEGEGANAKAS